MGFSEAEITDAILHNVYPWFPTLTEALLCLPEVNSSTSKRRLEDELERRLTARVTGSPGARDPSLDGIEELFVRDAHGNARVSPRGATLLLQLFEQDRLDQVTTVRRSKTSDLEALRGYAASSNMLRQKAIAYLISEQAEKDAVLDPASIRPDAFSYSLLNMIFYRHKGSGAGSMRIGGVTVEKVLSDPIRSRRGAGHEFRVRFLWTDPDTSEVRAVEKGSAESHNRRLDAARAHVLR